MGLSAAENLSPTGRSNIQTVQAKRRRGPDGEVEYRYRRYYGAAFVQDDIKVSARFTLNLGLRWEYIAPPSMKPAPSAISRWPCCARPRYRPPAGALAGNTVAANYDPALINPYTGQPFGPPPAASRPRVPKSFYENGAPRDTFAPRVGFAWQPFGANGRLVVGGGYGWFFQNPPVFSGNAAAAPLFTSVPFAQGFTNADSSNNLSTFAKPFPTTTLGYVPRTPTSQLSDRVAGNSSGTSPPSARVSDDVSGTWAMWLHATACCYRAVSTSRCWPAPAIRSAAVTTHCIVTNTTLSAARHPGRDADSLD